MNESDFEILTENGFKLFGDLEKNEKVACLNPDTGEMEYRMPIAYIKEKYKGKLNCGGNKMIDFAVTPNHNMYVSIPESLIDKSLSFSLIPSENVFNKNMHFKKDALWNGVEKKEFTIPGFQFDEQNPYPSGGVSLTVTITEEDLKKDTITFFAVSPALSAVPESQRTIEDLDQSSKIDEYSQVYASLLQPIFQ